MNRKRNRLRKACVILCFLAIGIPFSSAQTELIITYLDQTTESFLINEDGKLSFSQNHLIIYDGDENPVNVAIADIRKVNVAPKNTVSMTENLIERQSDIVLYPNPAGNTVCVKSFTSDKLSLSIYSIAGQRLLEGDFRSDEQIDISHLSPGVYILKTGTETIKFSKL